MKSIAVIAALFAQTSAITMRGQESADLFLMGSGKYMVTVAAMNAEGNYANI